jgi:hypothetical protein
MYGMVNLAIKRCVIEHYGAEQWAEVEKASGAADDYFIRMQSYPDELTTNLLVAAAKATNNEQSIFLEELGEYWIEFASKSEYGAMLRAAGNTLPEVISNLDALHSRLEAAFPELTPPSFWCSAPLPEHEAQIGPSNDALILHYSSHRSGLSHFVIGLVRGLANFLGVTCQVSQIHKNPTDETNRDETLFLIIYSA